MAVKGSGSIQEHNLGRTITIMSSGIMPLSKAKQAEWMREYRRRRGGVIPKSGGVIPDWVVQPNVYLQPMAVQPKSMVVQPNQYLRAHMKYCPDYDPVQPKFDPISTHY